MNKRERTNLILELSKILMEEDFQTREVILTTYGLESLENYDLMNESEVYIMNKILCNGSNERLIEVGSHFNLTEFSSVEEVEISTNQIHIFISHVIQNKELAEEFKEELENYGISCFVAHVDINPSDEWIKEIESNLKNCHALISILTGKYKESLWTDQEAGYALGLGKLIIPMDYSEVPYGLLSKFQALKANGKKTCTLVAEIINLLSSKDEFSQVLSNTLIRNYERSVSYMDADQNLSRIEKLSTLNGEQIQRIQFAGENNDQISDCFKISPTRLNNLEYKHLGENVSKS